MSAKKNRSSRQNQNTQIDYDKLARAIVRAQAEADELQKKRKDKEREDAKRQFQLALGGKNGLARFWRLLTLKKKEATQIRAATSLAQSTLSLVFQIGEWFLYIIGIFLGFTAKIHFATQWIAGISYTLLVVFSFVFARIFRLARFEVDQMTDKNYMIAMLSAVASFLAMIIALASLLVKRGV